MRVLVIEDSALQREVLVDICRGDPRLRVVGAFGTGAEGIAAASALTPDVITCDLGLPDVDGFEVVKQIMLQRPTPILVVTASLAASRPRTAYDTLALGALDVIEKPDARDLADEEWRARLRTLLHELAAAPVVPHVLERVHQRMAHLGAAHARRRGHPAANIARTGQGLVTVVGSAGSPKVMRQILEELAPAAPLPAPVVFALHLGPHMGASFAGFLAQAATLHVRELTDGMVLMPGELYVAPGRQHVALNGRARAHVFADLPGARYSPSLDHWLESVALHYGKDAAAAILTGIGADGAEGMLHVRRAGGLTLGQDPESCLVYGMPRAAFERGAVALQRPPLAIARAILDWLGVAARETHHA